MTTVQKAKIVRRKLSLLLLTQELGPTTGGEAHPLAGPRPALGLGWTSRDIRCCSGVDTA